MDKKVLAQEYHAPGEAACIQDLEERLKAKVIKDESNGIMRRDAHAKMHGVVKAEFIIQPNLPEHMQVGIFKEPKTYQAWARFSNANGINPDINRDIRGMAIKLMGVPGEKLLEQEKHEQTQDFLMISTNAFIVKDIEEFDRFTKAITGSLFAKLGFFLTHWRLVWRLVLSLKKYANPLQIRYFSTTPYLFGDHAVKYSVIPQVMNADKIPENPDDNFMRTAMSKQLHEGEFLFDFLVQRQMDAETMPIEDASKEWCETESPFEKVATIRIMQQNFDTPQQDAFGECLSFTPWHSLPEHRPLGSINRGRKFVYALISTFRCQKNKVQKKEPTSWKLPSVTSG